MKLIQNPFRTCGIEHPELADVPWPADDASRVRQMLVRCPHANETPLTDAPALAQDAGVKQVLIKDERTRMGLGSFKALGAAYVIARDAAEGMAQGRTYVTASAGNHGISVAAGASAFQAKSEIFIAETVPESFADRLREIGATVKRAGDTYEESMAAAQARAEASPDRALLSDSSWPGYVERPWLLMEGYLALIAEAADQIDAPPSHAFLQAGVGGFAVAMAAYMRARWGDAVKIVVVEPEAAPALFGSIQAGAPSASDGPVSCMGRLDCKEPSLIALKGLSRDADAFMTISEVAGQEGAARAAAAGLVSTPSGAAGLSGLLALRPDDRAALGIDGHSRVLSFLTEMSDD